MTHGQNFPQSLPPPWQAGEVSEDSSGVRPPNFSERYGHAPYPPPLQLDGLDERTRTTLYNYIYRSFLNAASPPIEREGIWMGFLGRYGHDYHQRSLADAVLHWVETQPYFQVFDLIEYLMRRTRDASHDYPSHADVVNRILALNRVGYRLNEVEALIIPITDTVEMDSVEAAATTAADEVRQHMSRAIRLFADRDNPQFAKSISESMLAAEAAANRLAGVSRKPLGDAVDALRNQGRLHGALAEGWKKLYGYTSQDGGIRHAMSADMIDPTQEFAQYFLVTCSAFVNLCAAVGELGSQP